MKPNIANLEFKNYFIKEINFKSNEKFIFPEKGMPIEIDFDYDIDFNIDSKSKAIAFVSLKVDLFKKSEKKPFCLSLTVTGIFESENLTKDEFEKMCRTNALAIMFPFVREIVSYITKSSNFPPLLLPPINIIETLKKKESQKH